MLISSINTSSYFYAPSSISTIDNIGKLYRAEAPSPTQLGDDNGMALDDVFIYSRMGLEADASAPRRGVVLENADGSYFKLDLAGDDRVNLVAKGGRLQLFVYHAASASAEKYVFDKKGVFQSAAELDVESFSAAEVSTRRDLDGNGSVGAQLLTTKTDAADDPITADVSKATGGVFQVNVMGHDIYVVGNRIDRLRRIDASDIVLKNSDGTFWEPPSEIQTLRAVSTTVGASTTWEVYGTSAEDTAGDGYAVTTRFSFNADNELESTDQLSAEEVIAAEVEARKDLNVDGAYGLRIEESIDATGGLVRGTLAGQDVLLAKVASTDTTGGRAVSLNDWLLDIDGSAWALPSAASGDGYSLQSIVKDTATDTVRVYATANDGDDVLRFDFALNADDRYEIDEETAAGVTVTAQEMALAEKTQKRDLNGDDAFGASIDSQPDTQTHLYKATMMGQEFYLAGNLTSRNRETARSATAAQSLGGALLNTDGTAWAPTVAGTSFTVTAMLNTDPAAAVGSREYTVYAKSVAGEVRKFVFSENADNDFEIDEDRPNGVIMDDPIALMELEKISKRDINGDSKYGATIASQIDTAVGLYRATIGANTYYLAGQDANDRIRTTGLTGAKAQDLSGALLNRDGSAWSLPSSAAGYTLKTIVDTSLGAGTSFSVYATKNDGDDVLRFDFEGADYADIDGNAVEDSSGDPIQAFTVTADTVEGEVVSYLDMAADEATYDRDLNDDGGYGASIESTIDRMTGLYTATLMGQDFYLAGLTDTNGQRKTATNGISAVALSGVLLNADGSAWEVKDGYTASALVKTSADGADPVTYTLYAYTGAGHDDVIAFDFEEDDDGNFVVTNDSIPGVAIDEDTLALREASLARDLNGDSTYGVSLSERLDNVGGLYQVSALGGDFLIAGDANLQPSASNPVDLSKGLKDLDGNAWTPDNVADVTDEDNRLILVGDTDAGDFTVYVKDDNTDWVAYDFESFQQVGNSRDLSTEDLAAAEKSAGRDISGDGLYGANITAGVDLVGGLYQGSLGSHTDVYFKADPGLALGSLVASNALDFTSALKTASGYWAADAGFTVKTAFDDGTDFVLIAKNVDGDVRRYTFDTTNDNQIDMDQSGLLTADELATLEETEGRDLNKDGVLAVRVNTTALDAVEGLYLGNNGSDDYIIVADSAGDITNLDTALLDADGNRWDPGVYDKLTLVPLGVGAADGYDVYAKNGATVTRYSFDTNYTLTNTSEALTDIEVALAEAETERDINADSAVGAIVTSALSRSSGLYAATVGSTDVILLAHTDDAAITNVGGVSTLVDRLLYDEDGVSAWDADGYTLMSAAYNMDGGDVSSIYVFAQKDADSTYHRFMFTAGHVLEDSVQLTDEQIAASAAADDPAGSYVDADGGLFKASVLGQDFYVVGDTTGAESAVADLSQALFDGDGEPWAPGAGYQIGGMVTNVDTYDVYTFTMNGSNVVTSVKKSTWDSEFNFMGTAEADPALLADVEITESRDLSGDSVVGFKVQSLDPADGYKGVTGATMVNGATYLLAGSDLSDGELGLDKVLLNADGSAAWTPDANTEMVKFVDERGAGDDTRYVYTIDDSGSVNTAMRYEFTKATGKQVGEGVAISMFEMAVLEEAANTDIDDDNYVGAVTVSVWQDDSADPSPSYGSYSSGSLAATSLLEANYGGDTFLIVNEATTGDGKLTMSGALLNQDGTAWEMPAGFNFKGIYQQAGTSGGFPTEPLQLYGTTAAGATVQYQFAANVDEFGARTTGYTLMDAKVASDGYLNPIQGGALATTEMDAALDLNGDGAIGYLKGNTVVSADSGTADNSWTLATASVSNGAATASTIYVVSEDMETTSSISASDDDNSVNTVAGGALYASDGETYWEPDEGYTVTAILDSDPADDLIEVWARGTASDGSKVYQQYVFDGSGGNWTATASSLTLDADYDGDGTDDSFSSSTMLGEEVTSTRDLNGDGAVGLKVMDRISGTGVNAYEAEVDGVTYYIVGDDTTVATGTPTAPADPTDMNILYDTDGTTLWTPSGVIGGIREATAADILLEADAAYTVDDGGTDVYFDSSFTKL